MKCNLKKLTTILILIVSLNICSAQELSKIVRNDFCKNAEFDSKYGNGNMKTLLGYCARNIGINTFEELVTAIENICYNYKLQEEFFKLIYTSNSNRDVLFMQFHSIGMKPENATKLTDYVLAKYDNENKEENKNTESSKTIKNKIENFDLSKDKYENETAIVKDIINVENEVFIVVDVITVEYKEDMDFEIINKNTKLRTYKVVSTVLIKDIQCMESSTSKYLIDNRKRIISPNLSFVLISTNNNGELTNLNLGCWN